MQTLETEMNVEPVVLEGESVRLEPLSLDHLPRLVEVGLGGDVFRWFPQPVRSADDMRAFVEASLADQAAGRALPFATIERRSGLAVGSTRYGNIDRDHRRVEIGWTWLAPAWQRTALNTEAKYLMLRYAFETWNCHRVEFKTDSLNVPSRRALERIGARQEGTLRNHMVTAGGRLRHSVYFSVIREEWPGVEAALEAKLRG
ncbi:MAG TPA: GNAT family protein [Terriglobia bacterium]|nr:GNAT family protein [Terriglobia bacterium]